MINEYDLCYPRYYGANLVNVLEKGDIVEVKGVTYRVSVIYRSPIPGSKPYIELEKLDE